MEMYNFGNILGLKVTDIRGFESSGHPKKRPKKYQPHYILFDDGKTYIELEKQDYYSYHDCASWARAISIFQDEKRWKDIKGDLNYYPPANDDI
jgi:hypothetical protein